MSSDDNVTGIREISGRVPVSIAIVTPSLNHGRFIGQTIDSVLSQDYQPTSYWVVDGGSVDDTVRVIKNVEHALDGWVSEPDSGQSEAINKGWNKVSGADLYAWINSDDYFLPGALRRIAEEYLLCKANGTTVGVFSGSGYKVNIEGQCIKDVSVQNITQACPGTAFQFLQSSVFFSGEALRECGGLRNDLHYSMDWELVLRISKNYQIRYVDDYLSCQRIYPETKTSSGGWKRNKEIADIGRLHNGIFDRNHMLYWLYATLLRCASGMQPIRRGIRYKIARILQGFLGKLLASRSYMIYW